MIQVFKPVLRVDEILHSLRDVLTTGWIGLGPKTAEFEAAISEYLGVNSVVCTNSCTSALHMAVKSLNLRPGTRVLTTPITFASTNHVLLYEGLVPTFCDVDRLTGNIDAEQAEKELKRNRYGAVMVVHVGGYPCDMD